MRVKQQVVVCAETDPRFPSGCWAGFFLQKQIPGKHEMELILNFNAGVLTGEGRDWVGAFIVRGRYHLDDGRCYWVKSYLGKHDVFYEGFNEGKGVWGTWEIPDKHLKGGFHIWPEGKADSSGHWLSESADLPDAVEEKVEVEDPILVPA